MSPDPKHYYLQHSLINIRLYISIPEKANTDVQKSSSVDWATRVITLYGSNR